MNDSEQELLKAWLEAAGADGQDIEHRAREHKKCRATTTRQQTRQEKPMTEWYESKAHTLHDGESTVTLHHGDCIEAMNQMLPESVDAIVTDPPYGLGFMGKKWDDLPPSLEWAEACYRVLKPGGHIAAFGGTRTWHRLAVAIEDAGFEMRDSLAWLYGSGFPKSHDVSKAIDKLAGAEREVIRARTYEQTDGGGYSGNLNTSKPRSESSEITAPATPEAKQWDGWGTALKPAFEPIVLARKPLAEKTVAKNVLAHGTGALNIDACRVGNETRVNMPAANKANSGGVYKFSNAETDAFKGSCPAVVSGRWPANVVLDQHAAAWVDEQSGGASRFFYTAKAPKRERPNVDGVQHPTVKPLAIMRWLVRLVTPPGGTVLDPFAGSGTTLEAALIEGFNPVGIELEAEYIPLIQHRIDRQEACATTNPYEED